MLSLNALLVKFLDSVALKKPPLRNSCRLFLTFRMNDALLQLNFASEPPNTLEPPLVHFLFVLCLISLDFATCSLIFQKHVLNNENKCPSTFASLALIILAPFFVITVCTSSR